MPVLVLGAVIFGAGMVCFALTVLASGVVEPGLDRVIAVSLVVLATSRFVPFAAVQFYLQSIACCAALLLLRTPSCGRRDRRTRPPLPQVGGEASVLVANRVLEHTRMRMSSSASAGRQRHAGRCVKPVSAPGRPPYVAAPRRRSKTSHQT